jgi:hypothetical protein
LLEDTWDLSPTQNLRKPKPFSRRKCHKNAQRFGAEQNPRKQKGTFWVEIIIDNESEAWSSAAAIKMPQEGR